MKPPQKNSERRITINSVTSKGFGVGEIDGGFVVFADGLLPGDVADILLVKAKKTYGYAKTLQIVSPSVHRVKSPCTVSQRCGGCQFLHCEYEAQLAFKKRFVQDALQRIGGIAEPPVADVLPMDFGEKGIRYRNKAVFPIVPHANEDGFAIGMFAPRSHNMVEVTDCLIQNVAHVKVLRILREHMKKRQITAYDEVSHKGLMRFVLIRSSEATGEVMVVLVANGNEIPGEVNLTAKLADAGASTVLVNKNTARGNTILGGDFHILSGKGFITETVGDVKYQISAASFFQINTRQAEKLYRTALEQAGLSEGMTVVDAHVGAGGVLLPASRLVKKAMGVDALSQAIIDARENALQNGISNAEFLCGTAEDALPKILQDHAVDVVFFDPPRKGCEPALLDSVVSAEIGRIVYISCDPATLARDIKLLGLGGYKLVEAIPVDMFPFTGKVEICCLLLKNAV